MEYEHQDVDPKVPVLHGESLKDFVRYRRAVEAAHFSMTEDEQKRLGPKLYQNLLGVKTSVPVLIEQLEPKDLLGADGAAKLIKYLVDHRFGTTSFREMPRVYDAFLRRHDLQEDGRGTDGGCHHVHARCEA